MLTELQKREFVEQGFLKIPGVVPKVLIDAARRAVTLRLSEQLAFDFFLSDEPERHGREADDSRLTLVSASLRLSF